MAREWSGIDRLRLDKFMGLVRRFLGAGFHAAAGTGFAASATARRYVDLPLMLGPCGWEGRERETSTQAVMAVRHMHGGGAALAGRIT